MSSAHFSPARMTACMAAWIFVLTCVGAGGAQNVAAAQPTATPATQAANPFAQLHWQIGPCTAVIGSHASLRVPAGYAFLSPADAKKFLELNQNPVGSTRHYILTPKSMGWFVDFSFSPIGYVKDNQKIDAAAVLQTVRQGNQAANEVRARHGWAPMTIIGWKYPPRYDTQTRRLEWAILASSGNQEFVNYNTRILGRRGVTSALLVDNPQNLDTDVMKFNGLLGGFHYNPDDRYSAYKTGDKIAEYGLAALITGGAAAVALKTGLLAVIIAKLATMWKLLVAGGAAVAAFFRRLFRRPKKSA